MYEEKLNAIVDKMIGLSNLEGLDGESVLQVPMRNLAVMSYELDVLIKEIQMNTMGWVYGELCNMLDGDVDPRKVSVPTIVERAKEDGVL